MQEKDNSESASSFFPSYYFSINIQHDLALKTSKILLCPYPLDIFVTDKSIFL